MNVLLTCAGRRSYLVHYFREALNGSGKVICANTYEDAPAMCVADEKIKVPFSHEKDYIPAILDICKEKMVGLLCSLHDIDVYYLSRHLELLRSTGVIPIIPEAKWGRACLDKYEFSLLAAEWGLDTPWCSVSLNDTLNALNAKTIQWPVLVKARFGFGSLGMRFCADTDQLKDAYEMGKRFFPELKGHFGEDENKDARVFFQETIEGKEYCIDVVNDFQGRFVCNFMCEVHQMRSGESDRATTVDPEKGLALARKLSELTSHVGIWGIDVLDDEGTLRIIDVNPRFTGDYPFQQIAGANIPAAYLAWAQNRKPDPKWFSAEIGVTGYKDLVPTRLQAR